MKIYAINGSPRKKWNTWTILDNILTGAKEASPNIEAEMVNLYDYHYQGCISCFACKRLGGASYGKCAVKDDIHELLQQVLQADIVVFGSPIYFGNVTGMMRSFQERLFFPCFVYDRNYSSLAPRKLRSGFIYTMNVPFNVMEDNKYPANVGMMEWCAGHLFGHKPKTQYINNTWQFNDYSKYKSDAFSVEDKKRSHEEQFPKDCEKARQMGKELASEAQADA